MLKPVRVARWRHRTRGGRPFHPSYAGYWSLAGRLGIARPPKKSNGSFTAILLVHQRPANLDMQIRAALLAPSVADVVVSCNRPDVKLSDWITVSSPRLRLLEETGRNQTRRYAIALDTGGDKFVLPDDDVLYSPEAFDEFCRALPTEADRPIGLAGQRLRAPDTWESAIRDTDEEVDVLNRAYVCTRAHAEGVFKNAELLGWSEEETFSNPADDVLVSFAGRRCPTLFEFEHINCVSHADAQIATYRQHDFHPARADWVRKLRKGLDRAPARRDQGPGGALPNVTGAERIVNLGTRPLRRQLYFTKNPHVASRLPRRARELSGLADYDAIGSTRVQIGIAPAPLRGFVRMDDRASVPGLTTMCPQWAPNWSMLATEVVAFGVLDRIDPSNVPLVLASWRTMMFRGARVIVGVTDSSRLLAERDAKIGVSSWASQLPAATEPMTSPLQLTGAGLTTTLWDEERLRHALESQGFDCVSVVSTDDEIDANPDVAPWHVDVRADQTTTLLPVPTVLTRAADIIVVARVR